MRERIVTGAVLLGVGVAVLLVGGILLQIVASCLFVAAAYEFFATLARLSHRESTLYAAILALMPIGYLGGGATGFILMAALAFVAIAAFEIIDIQRDYTERALESRIFYVLIGVLYVGFLATFLVILSSVQSRLPLWLVLVVVATDTFAYFGGRFFGDAKLAERISPKKTVVGAASGVVGALIVGAAFSEILDLRGHWVFWALAAACISPISQVGDLFESLLKRVAGVKDSGTLLPGHGGVLDRIDGLLFAAPMAVVIDTLMSGVLS